MDQSLANVVDEAKERMRVFTRGSRNDAGYTAARQTMNARLERRPAIIAECNYTADVAFWMKKANEVPALRELPLLVRSGGHQHEGRSTDAGLGNAALVLDLSHMTHISKITGGVVRIEPGAPLNGVTRTLAEAGVMIPVGGCGSVRAGGLTQGGGWGLSWRNVGMTIDKLAGATIVTPDGKTHGLGIDTPTDAPADEQDLATKLFWAIRGGGGGNFGVVTELAFNVTALPTEETLAFTAVWDQVDRYEVARAWARLLARHDDAANHKLDSFLRMAVTRGRGESPVTIGGRWRGSEADLRSEFAPLLTLGQGGRLTAVAMSEEQLHGVSSGSPDVAATQLLRTAAPDLEPHHWAIQVGAPTASGPATTCGFDAQRHKVSSSYPTADSHELLETLARLVDQTAAVDGANLYVSLHGMGGAASAPARNNTAYSWRTKPWLAQIQAWWFGAEHDAACLSWVERMRTGTKDVSEGAFISFPDENQPVERYYDAERLETLRKLKALVDPDRRMRFPLSLARGVG